MLLFSCETCFLSDSQEGQTFLFKSISCEGAFFYHRHSLSGLDFSLCVKEQAPKDDYGKEFQQKIRGASVRTFS
jgi:hypothetical protein